MKSEKQIKLENVNQNRGSLSEDHSYEPTPYEEIADLMYLHHSDGGITEVLHTKPEEETNTLPLVMVAGFITIMDSWEDVLSGLQNDFEIYYWESREKGTFHPPNNLKRHHFTPERFTKDLVELIEAIGLDDGSYLLAGSSFGGTIMIDALAEKKVRPHTALLIGANTHFHVPFPGNLLMYIVPHSFISLFKPVMRWYLRTFMVDMETDEKQYKKYAKALDLANFKFIKHTVINYHVHPQEDKLQDIEAKTIVVGAKLDKMHTINESKMSVEKIPNAELAEFETNADTHSKPFVDYLIDKYRE